MEAVNLFQYIERTAKKLPFKNAVTFKEDSITYKELVEISSKLAALLKSEGIKSGDRIGIYTGKSIEMIISVYAVMQAGAICVPLDPLIPIKRLEYIISDCGIGCFITNQRRLQYIEDIISSDKTQRLIILTDRRNDNVIDVEHSQSRIVSWDNVISSGDIGMTSFVSGDSDIAYILYTSGTSGKPKGIKISHRNAMTFVDWAARQFQLTEHDRLSNYTPLHFDLSVFDIYSSAAAGSTVNLIPEEYAGHGTALVDFIVNNCITVWYSVPSVLIKILLSANVESLRSSSLRTILFAGEVFPVKYLRQLYELLPGVELYNLYGPTETNVCMYHKILEADLNNKVKASVPIGKPCDYADVFLDVNPEAADKEGELYVGGPTVMAGYWNKPGKTSDFLVRQPDSVGGNKLFYRTGDIVKIDGSGKYVFAGRCDTMVKSRGYRIELGELESVLLSHPDIIEAAAVSIPDDICGNRIIAYYCLHQEAELHEKELDIYCAQYLPRYMIPERLISVPELLRTSTGKVDRQALRKVFIGQEQNK